METTEDEFADYRLAEQEFNKFGRQVLWLAIDKKGVFGLGQSMSRAISVSLISLRASKFIVNGLECPK
jgi:hypothetical protein